MILLSGHRTDSSSQRVEKEGERRIMKEKIEQGKKEYILTILN